MNHIKKHNRLALKLHNLLRMMTESVYFLNSLQQNKKNIHRPHSFLFNIGCRFSSYKMVLSSAGVMSINRFLFTSINYSSSSLSTLSLKWIQAQKISNSIYQIQPNTKGRKFIHILPAQFSNFVKTSNFMTYTMGKIRQMYDRNFELKAFKPKHQIGCKN